MGKIPKWAKILGAVLLTVVLVGASRLLLWIDKLASVKGGLD